MSIMDIKHKYTNEVLKELKLISTFPFKNLLIHIRDSCKNVSEFNYEFNRYFLDEKFTIVPIIRFIQYKNTNTYVYINCLFFNQYIYRNRDFYDEDEEDCEFLNILHFHEQLSCDEKNLPYIFKLANAILFIDKIKEKYIYSKYHDSLMLKTKYSKQILIEMEEDAICKRPINECVVCYEIMSSELKTFCCKQSICRVCVERLNPQKCPYCREEF